MELTEAIDIFERRLHFYLKDYKAVLAQVVLGDTVVFDVLVEDDVNLYRAGAVFKLALQDFENITINIRTKDKWINRKGAITAWRKDSKVRPRT